MTPSLQITAFQIAAFFDELRALGFVEGQNLKIDGGGYGLRDEQSHDQVVMHVGNDNVPRMVRTGTEMAG